MIRIGIVGYGNLGKGVEQAIKFHQGMELVAVFSRRKVTDIKITSNAAVEPIENILDYKDKIDVMILCGGSASDLPKQSPELVKHFNIVDSFDTHALINQHYNNVNKEAKDSSHVGVISIGWDPGLFSLNRLIANAVLPNSKSYTFWGDGVSQGHSEALRRIEGVKHAIQYTRPIKEAVDKVISGENPDLSTKEKHLRDCYIIIKDGYDKEDIKKQITTMPNYFAEYNTIVNFIDENEFFKTHTEMIHGGKVITSGTTSTKKHLIEYNLKLDSNPEFTASTLLAYARACYRFAKEKNYGAKTIFDIPASYLLNLDDEKLREQLL